MAKLTDEQILCQQGPRITELVKKGDFSDLFATVCTNGDPNEVYQQLMADKYNGTNEAKITVLKAESGDLLVTELILGFVIAFMIQGKI